MKTFPLLTSGLALMCLSLSQCVVTPVESVSGPATYSSSGAYYGGSTYVAGGYGATGRVATNAMWAGVTAYGIHERNETRQDAINTRNNRVEHSVNNYHKPPPHGGGGGGKPPGGGSRPPKGGGGRPPPKGGGGRPHR